MPNTLTVSGKITQLSKCVKIQSYFAEIVSKPFSTVTTTMRRLLKPTRKTPQLKSKNTFLSVPAPIQALLMSLQTVFLVLSRRRKMEALLVEAITVRPTLMRIRVRRRKALMPRGLRFRKSQASDKTPSQKYDLYSWQLCNRTLLF